MGTIRKIARYEVLEEKGRGAMGAVYVARDPAMDRIVALKTIHTQALSGPQGNEYRERFFREARAAGRLAHPGIVQMFDVGEDDGVPFMVMEFVEGQTLADSVKNGERFTLERVSEVGQQLAEALGFAHSHGVVHRDIKPANILMTSKAKYGVERPKITDFGVAKYFLDKTTQITTSGQMLGTPAFMPPEQFLGSAIDGRSDLFSLGVILYWLSTGEQAFPGETITAVSYKVVHTEPVPPRKLNPAIPAGLETIISKCLMKDPTARYQTGEALAGELAALREGRGAGVLAKSPAIKAGAESDSMNATLDGGPQAMLPKAAPVDKGQAGQTLGTDTLGPVPTMPKPAPAVPLQPAPPIPVPGKKAGNNRMIAAGAAIVVVLLLSGWVVHKIRSKRPAVETPAVAVTAANDPAKTADIPPPADSNGAQPGGTATPGNSPAPATPDVKKAAADDPSGHPTAPAPAKKTPKPAKTLDSAPETKAATPATQPVGPPVPAPAPVVVPTPEPPKPAPPARVDFDPKAIDPNASEKVKIDASHFPINVDFTLEMDGKIYFERGAAKTQTTFENYFVPPGIHEFRVRAGTGANRKTSNIVSMEFKAKKKKTLEIELRGTGAGDKPGVPPQDVNPDSQLVLMLR